MRSVKTIMRLFVVIDTRSGEVVRGEQPQWQAQNEMTFLNSVAYPERPYTVREVK
jgi:hypothetical protein